MLLVNIDLVTYRVCLRNLETREMLSIILARICSFIFFRDVLNRLHYVSSELYYSLFLIIDRHSEFWGQNS